MLVSLMELVIRKLMSEDGVKPSQLIALLHVGEVTLGESMKLLRIGTALVCSAFALKSRRFFNYLGVNVRGKKSAVDRCEEHLVNKKVDLTHLSVEKPGCFYCGQDHKAVECKVYYDLKTAEGKSRKEARDLGKKFFSQIPSLFRGLLFGRHSRPCSLLPCGLGHSRSTLASQRRGE